MHVLRKTWDSPRDLGMGMQLLIVVLCFREWGGGLNAGAGEKPGAGISSSRRQLSALTSLRSSVKGGGAPWNRLFYANTTCTPLFQRRASQSREGARQTLCNSDACALSPSPPPNFISARTISRAAFDIAQRPYTNSCRPPLIPPPPFFAKKCEFQFYTCSVAGTAV